MTLIVQYPISKPQYLISQYTVRFFLQCLLFLEHHSKNLLQLSLFSLLTMCPTQFHFYCLITLISHFFTNFFILQISIDTMKDNGFIQSKAKSRQYFVRTNIDADYADNQALLTNTPAQAEELLHCLEQATRGIGLYELR